MFNRSCFGALLLAGLLLPFAGCGSSNDIDSITVTPTTLAFGGTGLTGQLTATATIGHGSHPATFEDVTSLVTWTSGSNDVATVSSSGLVTSTGSGSIQITGSIKGFTGLVSGSATITVTAASTGPTGGSLVSLMIIPGTQSVSSPSQTTQFLAIGTTTTGATENVTNQVAWTSSTPQIATVSASGLATGLSQGTTTITAIATNSNKTVVTGTATFSVLGGASEPITALSITPPALSLSAEGQTGQLIALGTTGSSGALLDVTSSSKLRWSSSLATVATVSSTGLVTGVSAGSTTITAEWTNPDLSVATATAAITTTLTAAPEPLLSLSIIPATLSVGNLQDTGNFLAIGTFSTTPNVRDLTNSVNWISTFPESFPVSTNSDPTNPGAAAGIVTAYGNGTAVIVAEATDPKTGSIQTATSTFSCPLVLPSPGVAGSCYPGSQANGLLDTLTVYNEGLNTTNWLVTAPSATGTIDVLHCGPGWAKDGKTGGSVCTATYPLGTTVTLTAPAQSGVKFGGWSYNCISVGAVTESGPNSCTIQIGAGGNTNVTVGAIFN